MSGGPGTLNPMNAVSAPVHLWVPPALGPQAHRDVWLPLGDALSQAGVAAPRRTTRELTQDWAADVALGEMTRSGLRGFAVTVEVVRRGVAPEDLFWLASKMSEYGLPVSGSPAGVCKYLARACAIYPGHTVRSMLGWSLVKVGPHTRAEWADVGIAEDGWLYAAAGFTAAEALAMRSAGALDPAQAAMMAGLRGARLPVG